MPTAPRSFQLLPAQDRHKQRAKWKGSASDRGYDHEWRKLRTAYIAENPWCVECHMEGVVTVTELEVDHVVPFNGINDPLRLDWSNLQTLCKSHHQRKTKGSGSM